VLSTEAAVEAEIADADLVVGAVLLPGGAQTPHLIKKSMLKNMMPGSVLVDVAIDQGGCFETSKPPRTPSRPTWSTASSTTASPTCRRRGSHLYHGPRRRDPAYGLAIANKGFEKAVADDAALALGVNVYRGKLTIRRWLLLTA